MTQSQDRPRDLAGPHPERRPFVGRKRELASLQERLTTASHGDGGVVLVSGEPGIGKTRLARELARTAREQEVVALWGRCFEDDVMPSYRPWAEALGDAVHALPAEELGPLLGVSAAPLARLVPAIRTAVSEVPALAALRPEDERLRLYDAVTTFLGGLTQRWPILLVLDDLQWADADSLALLRHLARFANGLRLLIVSCYRETEVRPRAPLHETLEALRHDADAVHIPLPGLRETEVERFVEQSLERPDADRLARVLVSETGGNPLYLGELLRHLDESGMLDAIARGTSSVEQIRHPGVPASVRQVVARRVARLSEETNTVLRLVAGCPDGFDVALLQEVTELPEAAVLDCLDEALAAQLIRAVDDASGDTYEFAHAIIRQALYDESSPSRRMRLHRRIAEALAALDEGRGRAGAIAVHYHASNGLPSAEHGIPYALAAADEARAAAAHERAVTFLRIARDLAAESAPAPRAGVLSRLALAEADALLLATAARTAEEALAAQTAAGYPPTESADFLATAARALKDGGAERQVWEPLVARGLALIGDERSRTWAWLMLLRDPVAPVRCEGLVVGRWLGFDAEAVALARAGDDEEEYARTLEPFDWRTRQETEAVLALAQRWRRPTAIMCALNAGARELLYRHGDLGAARRALLELRALSERSGSIPQQAEALNHLTFVACAYGDFDEARALRDQAQALMARLGGGHRLRLLGDVLTHYVEGDWSSLAATHSRALSDPEAAASPLALPNVALAIFAQMRAGDEAEARRLLAAVTPLLQQFDPHTWVLNATVTIAAGVVWELEATEFASAYRRLALDLIAAGVGNFPLVSNELTVARMAALLGDMRQAEDFFARVRVVCAAEGRRPERAMTDADEALALLRVRAADPARAATMLDAALAQFRALGMKGWAERVRRRAEQLSTLRAPLPAGLTEREAEVLALLADGASNPEIAEALVISRSTVERHVFNIYRKIDARGRADAVAYALRHGLAATRESARPPGSRGGLQEIL